MDFQDYLKEKLKNPEYKLRFDKHYQEALSEYNNKNFFQKTINTPIGYFTRGELIALSIALLLEALVVLIFCWVFIVGLWIVIG